MHAYFETLDTSLSFFLLIKLNDPVGKTAIPPIGF